MAPMLPDGRRLGAHLPLGGGMVKAVDHAHEIGADALQIFSDNPMSWRRRASPPGELEAFRARLQRHHIAPVAIHAAYLVNLAGPDPDVQERSVGLLATELRVAPTFGARFVNVHIGSHRGEGVQAGIRRLAEGTERVLASVDEDHAPDARGVEDTATDADRSGGGPAMLVLENSAGSGWNLGSDLDEMTAIADAIAARAIPDRRVGFCLDTAHAWGAGIDLSWPDAIDAFLAAFDDRIGLDRLVMVHFNDSRAERGSRLDRHEHIGAGRIGERGLAHIIRHPSLAHATYILETPGMDEGFAGVNMARARALAAGEPLPALPADVAGPSNGSSRSASRRAPA